MIAPDVGGGFGSKLNVYAEEALLLVLARKLGLPVKWIEERVEGYLATIHGRDVVQEIELAATAEGKITAVRARAVGEHGRVPAARHARASRSSAPGSTAAATTSRATTSSSAASSRTRRRPTPTAAPAGPEATYLVERAMDALARKLDLDPVELRRRNFIARASRRRSRRASRSTPATTTRTLDRALELLDYDGFRREQAERRERGDTKLLGVGFSTYVEMCGLAPSRILGAIRYAAGGWDAATIRCLPTGTVQAVIGTSPHGQGHATTFSQIVADRLGVAYEDVEVLHGDTSVVAARDGHLRQPQPRGRRDRALERDREGDRQGAGDRGAPARGRRGGPELRGRHVHGRRHRQVADGDRRRRSRPGRRTTSRTGWSRGSRRPPSTTRRTSAGRRGCAHRRRRGRHRRRARSTSSATSRSTTSAT